MRLVSQGMWYNNWDRSLADPLLKNHHCKHRRSNEKLTMEGFFRRNIRNSVAA